MVIRWVYRWLYSHLHGDEAKSFWASCPKFSLSIGSQNAVNMNARFKKAVGRMRTGAWSRYSGGEKKGLAGQSM